ncbi:MAG: membrane dipeptidase [Actinomycetota bacterium]|nr:membrane dipeptidase [Actinomycetota bacterium]
MIADAHNDLLLELAHREHRLGETNVFARTWLPLLEVGDVGLQICPIFVELDRQPEGTLRDALGQAASFHRALRENPDRLVAVRSRADLDAVERGERIGLMLALEGVEPFGYELWGSTRSAPAAGKETSSAARSRATCSGCCASRSPPRSAYLPRFVRRR